jgi:coenzyme F420-0:L-glutamate ligase/coenzyme F420-1:gamma-L-glutamate ligase
MAGLTVGRMPLVLTALPGIPAVASGDDLGSLVWQSLEQAGIALADGDIVVVAQKIVSKAEGRTRQLDQVTPGQAARELAAAAHKDPRVVELMLAETAELIRCRPGVIVVQDNRGLIMANAGIDASNVTSDGAAVLLLPLDPDASAAGLRANLEARSGARIGVLIIDSFGRAWRMGTIGTAIGISGAPGLIDLRGEPDMNGRPLQTSELAAADELAAAASLVMGQAAEGTPVVHVRGFPYPLREGSAAELVRPKSMDMFR